MIKEINQAASFHWLFNQPQVSDFALYWPMELPIEEACAHTLYLTKKEQAAVAQGVISPRLQKYLKQINDIDENTIAWSAQQLAHDQAELGKVGL